jgi:putative glutamine amidotransferase
VTSGNTGPPVIGVTPGHAGPSPNREFCRAADILYCDASYLRCVEEAGGLPVLLPHMDSPALEELVRLLDGLLFTGGEDVHPQRYGDPEVLDACQISEARDEFEVRLFHKFFQTGKPVLAVCRGVQLVNVALGGTLIQDVPVQIGSQHHSQTQASADPSHWIQLEEGSRLARAFGTISLEVNSHHHQAVDRLAPGLKARGWSEEGIIEVVEHVEHPYLVGVQWHPERLSSRPHEQRILFEDFIQSCRPSHAAAR